MGCKEISYIVTEYFNEYFIQHPTLIGLCGIGPCYKPACDDFRAGYWCSTGAPSF